jgi:hypothetical protein
MSLQMPYLIANRGVGLGVYDVTNNFEEVFWRGKFWWDVWASSINENDIYHSHRDVRYLIMNNDHTKFDIYSVLRNELVCSIIFEYWIENIIFQIKDDMLYLGGYLRSTGEHMFYVFKLRDQQAELVYTNNFGTVRRYIRNVIDDLVFFTSSQNNFTWIYQYDGNELSQVGSFNGSIQFANGNQPENYLLNLHGNTLHFREINDFNNILISGNISGGEHIQHHDEGYFIYGETMPGRVWVHNYDLDTGQLRRIFTFPNNSTVTTFNQFITNSSYGGLRNLNEYFLITDGQLQKIGEKDGRHRSVRYTFFLPEVNKMVQSTNAGIWVYDYDMTVSDDDRVVVEPKTILLSNYPNPFNPETTISFILSEANETSLEIFNIRGQKVRTLVKGFIERGEHTVVWNGMNENRQTVGSGIYFYRLTFGENIETKRMLLLK